MSNRDGKPVRIYRARPKPTRTFAFNLLQEIASGLRRVMDFRYDAKSATATVVHNGQKYSVVITPLYEFYEEN